MQFDLMYTYLQRLCSVEMDESTQRRKNS